jgi:phosphoglycolate phosphatase-like HAD superfamily hydrolase
VGIDADRVWENPGTTSLYRKVADDECAAGVLTGSTSREEFTQAGAPHILDTVAGLPALLGITG